MRGIAAFKKATAGMIILLLCLALAAVSAGAGATGRPGKNILILNSYHQGFFWTDDEMSGIMDIMKNANKDDTLSVEYLDWKRYPTYENLEENRKHLKYKYAGEKIDLVLTTDDAATVFALNHREDIFSDAPVVFCGVDETSARRILMGRDRVTGVIQEMNPAQTVKAALQINPGIRKVYLVYDKTESGQSAGVMISNAISKMGSEIQVVRLDGKTTNEILEEVSSAKSDSIVISTNYVQEIDGDMVGFEYFQRELSRRSSVPVYSLYEAALGNGAVGGSMIIGGLQGEAAAKLVLRVLKGEDISRIGLDRTSTTRLLFDYYELKRFNIDIRSLPAGSEIVNGPTSVLKEHKNLVVSISILLVFLITFIIVLLFYLSRIKQMQSDLAQKNQELSSLNDDLTEADTRLREQFGRLLKTQKNLTSSEHRYALLFEKMRNGFCIVEPIFNSDGKVTDIRFNKANPGFYSQMGLGSQDVIGRNWFEVFDCQCQELEIYQKLAGTGGAERYESYYANLGTYYAGNIFAISNKEFGVIFDNITDYKTAIKEVKLLNTELEHRVRERTNELQLALDELEAFSYTVSHDLKSPLRAIDGYSRIILEDHGPALDEDTTLMLGNISKISKDMIDMINKLLQYSTTSRAELHKENVDISEMMNSVFRELVLGYPERNINLVIETQMPAVTVDRILFRQLLQNILSNAVKFTRDREKALIWAGCTIGQDQYVFYVKDNGAGFDMEYSGKLFGIFQRLHSEEEFEGSGVGLVTVKKIVEKHGGRVWIEGTPGSGATIWFTLPFSWEDSQ